ncbi:hypothethical protein (plasmid) [Ralstonia solanacearum CMR15]|nr:hypothethical protein [Ralstonia solanacearum CMR15]
MRPRSRGSQARIRRDDDDEKDRHRRDRGSTAGPRPTPKLMERAAHMRFRSDQDGWLVDRFRPATNNRCPIGQRPPPAKNRQRQ